MHELLWQLMRCIFIVIGFPYLLLHIDKFDAWMVEAFVFLPSYVLNWLVMSSEAFLTTTIVFFLVWITEDRKVNIDNSFKNTLVKYGWIIFLYPLILYRVFPSIETEVFEFILFYTNQYIAEHVIQSVPLLITVNVTWIFLLMIKFANEEKNKRKEKVSPNFKPPWRRSREE